MVMTQRSRQGWGKCTELSGVRESTSPSWRFEEGFLGEVRLEREELAGEERVKEC